MLRIIKDSTSLGLGLVMSAGDEVLLESLWGSLPGMELARIAAANLAAGLIIDMELRAYDAVAASVEADVFQVLSYGRY